MMKKDLEKIAAFINEHHVMSLASSADNELSVCSLFYAFEVDKLSFIVASSEDTLHIEQIKRSSKIAGNILLETKEVGKIQGVQFRGEMFALKDKELKRLYFKHFPYALALLPKLWQIKVNFFKMTDNKLGFGKKIIFEDISL
jgi:uncharacterized protein YhbP (UPF0306 family)